MCHKRREASKKQSLNKSFATILSHFWTKKKKKKKEKGKKSDQKRLILKPWPVCVIVTSQL
jgi:phosphoribosyl-AMP cyclohydrolase